MKHESLEEDKRLATFGPWVTFLLLTLCGGGAFWLAAAPHEVWTAARWNFVGALFVAVGGLLGALSTYNVLTRETRPASWACVLVGGAIIAGASLQFAAA